MIHKGTSVISFAGSSLAVNWLGPISHDLLNALHRMDDGSLATGQENPVYELDSSQGQLRLSREDELLYQGRSAGDAAAIFMDHAAYDLAYYCRLGPLFHAASVALGPKTLLLPGNTGAGKTTLAAWLSQKSWSYLSDELTCIETDSLNTTALSRALHFKDPIAAPLLPFVNPPEQTAPAWNPQGPFRSYKGFIVSLNRFRPHAGPKRTELSLIVFPRYMAGAERRIMRLSPAHTCARLMGCALNVRNLAGYGFNGVAQIARRVPAYSVVYDQLDGMHDELAALLAA